MLNWCQHDDCVVVYDSYTCPVCSLEEEKKDLESKFTDLEENLADVEKDFEKALQENAALEERIALLTPLED